MWPAVFCFRTGSDIHYHRFFDNNYRGFYALSVSFLEKAVQILIHFIGLKMDKISINTAKTMIEKDDFVSLRALLLKCIIDQSQSALTAVHFLAATRYTGVRETAFYSLLAWREAGLKSMCELALKSPFPHNLSLACEILSSLATGQMPELRNPPLMETWSSEVTTRLGDPSLYSATSEQFLRDLILSLDEADIDRLPSAISHSFWDNPRKIRAILSTASLRWVAVGRRVIDEYQRLITLSPNNENVFQSFFEKNPLILDPLAHRVWPKPDLHGKKEPDFLIQRSDNSYLVIEIETPGKPIVTKDGQIGAKVTQAVTQAMEYRSFLLERYQQAQSTFPNFSAPEALVIVGLERQLSDEERAVLRRENEHRANLKIIGFDAIAERATAIANNIVEGLVHVEKKARLK